MRSRARGACAAASAPFGAGVLGWPTSRWITVSPAASFSAAAAITSMPMNGSTGPALTDPGGGGSPAAAANPVGTGDGVRPPAAPGIAVERRLHGNLALYRGTRDRPGEEGGTRP